MAPPANLAPLLLALGSVNLAYDLLFASVAHGQYPAFIVLGVAGQALVIALFWMTGRR